VRVMRQSKIKNPGFTLVEVMIAVAIFTGIMVSLFSVLEIGRGSYYGEIALMDLQQSARRAVDGIVRELRNSRQGNVSITGAGGRISFFINASANPISYYQNGTRLVREHPAGVFLTAGTALNNVSFCCIHGGACDLDCASAPAVQVNLSFNKTVLRRPLSLTVKDRVRLRN